MSEQNSESTNGSEAPAAQTVPPTTTGVPANPGAISGDQNMIPKARFDEVLGQVGELADLYLSQVPENLKALIPEEMSPAAKVRWFEKAKATGVFNAVQVPETDKGKPQITPRDQDLSNLPPAARMARGYGTK